ncbi:MAG: histidinol dehydrogenase [Methanomassiliicoccaceae archaeon]|nr:histidinol dehydrogenase [Methanomassiliicoccaceae archaeon]
MWKQLDESTWLKARLSGTGEVAGDVHKIVEQVRDGGDRALIELTKRFDKVDIDSVVVTRDEIDEAYEEISEELLEALEAAAANIHYFHKTQKEPDLKLTETDPGVLLGIKTTPLQRVGAYIPGGRASYPSTALMNIIPAVVAGVPEIVCCTPSPVDPATLVAMDIAGADEIYRVGGVQAIAAMALGTESIEPVQKIVGPGNVYVTAAKELLRGIIEIDFPAGPSEIGVIADSAADPAFIASDILAQAEHDPRAACVLATNDKTMPLKVWKEIEKQMSKAPRLKIIKEALKNSGYVVKNTIGECIDFMNIIAPEHLSLQVADGMRWLNEVMNAGSIFVGPYSPVAAGDYASGTNHTLPTAGRAAVFSGLNVSHFTKTSTVQIISKEGLEDMADIIETIAEAEGLIAHRDSVRIRLRGQ